MYWFNLCPNYVINLEKYEVIRFYQKVFFARKHVNTLYPETKSNSANDMIELLLLRVSCGCNPRPTDGTPIQYIPLCYDLRGLDKIILYTYRVSQKMYTQFE